MDPQQHILVVEDNLTTAKTLRLFLQSAGYAVVCVPTGDEALALFKQQPFDLVLLDIMLPGLDGIGVCQRIRETSHVPIVMLTAKTSEDDIVYGLENGANDYVCKPFGSKELLARIRCCLRRQAQLAEAQQDLVLGDILLSLSLHSVWVAGGAVKLTKTEFAILATMMQQVGRVFTREQLIQSALGVDYDGFDRTIDTHIWSLRKKLQEPKGNPRYLHSEMGIGYRLQDAMAKEHQ